MRLLIVEDEPRIVEVLTATFEMAHFAVDAAATAGRAGEMLHTVAYDAAILDLGLPDGDGLELLAAARASGLTTPILVLTARDAVEDRVKGLDGGADDYLVKPFATIELVARVNALLRRPGGALGTLLVEGNVAFDTIGREARVGEVSLPLSRREAAVLEHLLRRAGRTVPRAVLEDKLYGFDQEVESNAVPVHIHHLRRKLKACGAAVQIHTVRGVGYLLAEAT